MGTAQRGARVNCFLFEEPVGDNYRMIRISALQFLEEKN